MKLLIILILNTFLISCQNSAKRTAGEEKITEPTNAAIYATVEFPSEDSTLLKGYLFRPKGQGPFPAVVALHGCGGLFKKNGEFNPRDLEWGQRLAAHGYVAIYPDSFTTRHISEICRSKTAKGMAKKIRPLDAYGALRWLQSLDYVKKESIALIGWSNGGSTLLAAIDEKFSRDKTLTDFKTAIAFYPGCVAAEKDQSWQNRMPVEILMGELDNWCPPQHILQR